MKKLLTPLVSTFVLVACGQGATTPPASSEETASSTVTGTSSNTGTATTTTAPTGTTSTIATSTAATGSGASGPTSSAAPTSTAASSTATSTGATGSTSQPDPQSTSGASATTSAASDASATTSDTSGTSSDVPSSVCPFAPPATAPNGQDWTSSEILEFNDNGGWCWYQDERVIVDEEAGKMIIGSVASGGSREAWVEVTHWDIAAKTGQRHHIGTMSYADDHDVPALVKRPDGGYVAMWAGHNDACESEFSVFDGSEWSSESPFQWPMTLEGKQACPTSSGKSITYANLWYIDDELISYVRSIDTSPHYLLASNGGKSWAITGRLTSTPQVGYVAGYYKYWGNHTDRLDFFGTEAHPRDNDNSLYHGYIEGGQIHKSTGEVVDNNFKDLNAQEVTQYSQVFKTGTTINGVKLDHMWNADLMRYDDGTIAAIGSGRVAGSSADNPDKRLLYFRFDGTQWKSTYLAQAGVKLYPDEQDYTGLGALHPDNPNVIYISTSYDPRTDEGEFNGKKEIWKGVTCDNGATFDWEPITANSQMDNLRPVVPKWDANHTALLWLRGTYTSAQVYNQKIVGFIEEH